MPRKDAYYLCSETHRRYQGAWKFITLSVVCSQRTDAKVRAEVAPGDIDTINDSATCKYPYPRRGCPRVGI